jgi:hypothetical protein
VPNKHTKQLHSKISAQFYVVRPIHAAPAYHKRPFAYIWPTNGQTAENRAKPNPPPRSPLTVSPDKKFPWPNGFSRRTCTSHEILRILHIGYRLSAIGYRLYWNWKLPFGFWLLAFGFWKCHQPPATSHQWPVAVPVAVTVSVAVAVAVAVM